MQIKHIFIALEFVLLLLFLVPFPIFCLGNFVGIFFSVTMIIITANWTKFLGLISTIWSKMGGRVGLIILAALIIVGIVYAIILSVNMYKSMRNKPDEANIVVVLGCKVNGERPSRMLRRRLDAAYDYMVETPDVMCIVSGGQGSDESVTEASAMKKYLVEKGIEESRIIEEDKSTSTDENIRYSLEIIDDLGLEHNITIVTDGFHQYRATLMAKNNGVDEVHNISAATEPRFVFTYWVREWFGLFKYQLFG